MLKVFRPVALRLFRVSLSQFSIFSKRKHQPVTPLSKRSHHISSGFSREKTVNVSFFPKFSFSIITWLCQFPESRKNRALVVDVIQLSSVECR